MKQKFPHPSKKNEHFEFLDGKFCNISNSSEKIKVLEYSDNLEGWSEDHTEMIDHEIGSNHPIDVSSRNFCNFFLKKFNKFKRNVILEIGCSSGNLINEIKSNSNNYYIGSDVLKKSVKKIAEKHENTPFVIFDILKNPFPENFCNTVIMLNVLEHIGNDVKALNEANKLLCDNGLLILEVPAGKFLYDEYDKQLLHFRRYKMLDLIKKIENAGFVIERKTHLGFFIFPVFILVKLFNKIFRSKNIISKQANLSNNTIVKLLFFIESKLREFSLPFGIRCFVCARKK